MFFYWIIFFRLLSIDLCKMRMAKLKCGRIRLNLWKIIPFFRRGLNKMRSRNKLYWIIKFFLDFIRNTQVNLIQDIQEEENLASEKNSTWDNSHQNLYLLVESNKTNQNIKALKNSFRKKLTLHIRTVLKNPKKSSC